VDKDGCHIGLVDFRRERCGEKWAAGATPRGVGDPSLRLKCGCAQDDAAEIRYRGPAPYAPLCCLGIDGKSLGRDSALQADSRFLGDKAASE
jgi:hypothetical protein